jgi:hypothetical protein
MEEWRRLIRAANPIVLGEDRCKTKMMMVMQVTTAYKYIQIKQMAAIF